MSAIPSYLELRNRIETLPEESLSTSLLPADREELSQFLRSFLGDKDYLQERPALTLRLLRVLPATISIEMLNCFHDAISTLYPQSSPELNRQFLEVPFLYNTSLLNLLIREKCRVEQCTKEAALLDCLSKLYRCHAYESAEKVLDGVSLVDHKTSNGEDLYTIVVSHGPKAHQAKMLRLYEQAGHPTQKLLSERGWEILRKCIVSQPDQITEILLEFERYEVDVATVLINNNYGPIFLCGSFRTLQPLLDSLNDLQKKDALTKCASRLVFSFMKKKGSEELLALFKLFTDQGLQLSYVLSRRNCDRLTPLDYACLENLPNCPEIIIAHLDDETLFRILRTPHYRTTLADCSYY